MSERFDLVIVGSGPAGLAAGVQAARRKLSHVVLERGELANTIHRYQKGKLVMAEPTRLPLQQELELRFEKGSREEILDAWREDAEAAGVNLRMGAEHELTRIEGKQGDFKLSLKGGGQIACKDLILAIGVQGNIRRFGVNGDDLPHVTYQLDDPAEHVGKRIAVVGAGDAGIENALALMEHENEVSIVNRSDEFDRAKPANRSAIEAAIQTGKITHYANARVDSFEEGKISFTVPSGQTSLDVDLVIGRLGAIPPRKFLEDVGIQFPSQDPEAVPDVSDRYESNIPGIHLIGALVGYPLIKNCMNQGFETVEHILGNAVEPADEPILREKIGVLGGSTPEILNRIRQEVPLFNGLTTVQLREFLVDSDVVVAEPEETIFQRNDFSDSFFAVLEGSVTALMPWSDADADSDLGDTERRERSFQLGAGQFFGEGSLLSGRRRSGTVLAAERCVLIETPRLTMNKLAKSVPEVQRVLHSTAIERRLYNLFPGISDDEARGLARGSFLETHAPGEILFREGDFCDGLYLIHRGAVTVSQVRGGRELVLNYVQAGNYVGEVGLITPEAQRTATVRATVLTETVRLPTQAVVPLLETHPKWREEFERVADDHRVTGSERAAQRDESGLLGFLMEAGAGEATDLLLIDESLCVRCDNCEKACAETHGGVSRLDREAGPTFDQIHIPTACRHCENPKCMTDCPPDALRRHPSGEVYIMDNCIGCGNCASNCPYDVIRMAVIDDKPPPNLLMRLLFGFGERRVAQKAGNGTAQDGQEKRAVKCDLCRNLPGARASCVASCPTGAIVRVNPRRYVDELMDSES